MFERIVCCERNLLIKAPSLGENAVVPLDSYARHGQNLITARWYQLFRHKILKKS